MFRLIAIDGRGGSGKSTLTAYIKKLLPGFTFLEGDDYFEPIYDQVSWGKFNDERFIQDVIEPLKTSNKIIYRPYNWHVNPPIKEIPMEIKDGLILERGYSFLFDLTWDLKIWVETPKEICFERGVSRETLPKSRAEKAWQEWQSDEDYYINDYNPKSKADIVIDGTNPYDEQLT